MMRFANPTSRRLLPVATILFGLVLSTPTVTFSQEVGDNDFRISFTGSDADPTVDALYPRSAYNSQNNEYLVVWRSDDPSGPTVEGETEIYGQLLDAETGAPIGGQIRISSLGPDGNEFYDADTPFVAYNSVDNEYLVVFCGDDNRNFGAGPLAEGEREVFGQLLDEDGNLIGATDFRISDMGPDGDSAYDVSCGDGTNIGVVHNPMENEYLVVWGGEDSTDVLVQGEFEIFGQLLDANGGEIAPNDFRISEMGPPGRPSYDGREPGVAWRDVNNQYLVVWEADDSTSVLVEGEVELYGQFVDQNGGLSGGRFRISDMGPDGDPLYFTDAVSITYNNVSDEFLVVWEGSDNTPPVTANNREIFAQRLDGTGSEVGQNDFVVSSMGAPGQPVPTRSASEPRVTFNALDNHYMVVWAGDDTSSTATGEFEIFGQLLHGNRNLGDEFGDDDFRLSEMGPDMRAPYDANEPDPVFNGINNEYLVVWYADDSTSTLGEGKLEVYGQRYRSPGPPGAAIEARVFLEGPYNGATDKMDNTLRDLGEVPLSQPFSDAAFDASDLDFDSVQTVLSLPDSVVDWMLVSLRTGTEPATEVPGSEHAALLYEDGRLATAGHDSLRFPGVADGSYHLVVKSRNHLDVMSSSMIAVAGGSGAWDFTTAETQAFGSAAQVEVESGVWGMFGGDSSVDGFITVSDFAPWLVDTKAGATGYLLTDFDLDRNVTITDFALWLVNTKAGASSKVP